MVLIEEIHLAAAKWIFFVLNFCKCFETSPDPNPNATKVRRENINIRIYQDVAWLTFDQYGVDSGDELMDMPGLSRETRFMEKQDGQWKIAYGCWLLEGDGN